MKDEWRFPRPSDVLFALLIGYALWLFIDLAHTLNEPPVIHTESLDEPESGVGVQQWRVNGVVRTAHHIATSKPDYSGGAFNVAGYDSHGTLLWSVSGITAIERVR